MDKQNPHWFEGRFRWVYEPGIIFLKQVAKREKGFGGVGGFDGELLGAVEGGGEVQEFGGGFGVAAVVVGVQDSDLIPIELEVGGEWVLFGFGGQRLHFKKGVVTFQDGHDKKLG